MTEHPPEEKKVVKQTNSGPGTFVGGNVIGNIINYFAPAHRPRPSADPAQRGDRGPIEGDYDDISTSLVGAAFLGFMCASATVYSVRGLPFTDNAPAPAALQGWIAGILFTAGFFACVAAFLARAAQGLELWARSCADITMDMQIKLLAHLPAGMARGLSALSSAAATTAVLLAVFYAWGEFGTSVQERANIARENAAAQAARARAAVRR
ncbi:hypothetical protein [Streptomyces anulatus]|uniref:hypothetical protein n=1 Tax=Streptomyces anulatus TaxID=1892 RepID=UPI002E80DC11|nr:hypothetical protein [Streptomyces anulatus]WUC91848.1 hypothetical protein OHQ35_37535 [Streptomyces anulatus]